MTQARATTRPMQHRSPSGQRHSGFAISIDTGRPRYARMLDDGSWSWTVNCGEAELFLTEERATAWAARNIGGGSPAVVGVNV